MASLKEFIDSQKAVSIASERGADWPKRLSKWLVEIDKLYCDTESLLLAAGLDRSKISRTEYQLHEQHLGSYQAPGLNIELPAGLVRFTPIATLVIGAFGRVDVTGPNRRTVVKLIVDDAGDEASAEDARPAHEREWVWRAYPGPGAKDSYTFDEDGLAKLLESVST